MALNLTTLSDTLKLAEENLQSFEDNSDKRSKYKSYIGLRQNLFSLIKVTKSINQELTKLNPYKKV